MADSQAWQFQPVKSSNLKAVAYDPAKQEMAVDFGGPGIYVYSGVTPEHHAKFVGADSLGKHFHSNIRGKFTHRQIERPKS